MKTVPRFFKNWTTETISPDCRRWRSDKRNIKIHKFLTFSLSRWAIGPQAHVSRNSQVYGRIEINCFTIHRYRFCKESQKQPKLLFHDLSTFLNIVSFDKSDFFSCRNWTWNFYAYRDKIKVNKAWSFIFLSSSLLARFSDTWIIVSQCFTFTVVTNIRRLWSSIKK